ncbi:MAG: hypothetical protein ACPIOQ_38380 [Promethearchaeia archaeon]
MSCQNERSRAAAAVGLVETPHSTGVIACHELARQNERGCGAAGSSAEELAGFWKGRPAWSGNAWCVDAMPATT